MFLVISGLVEAWLRLESRSLELRVRWALLALFMTVPTALWALYFFTISYSDFASSFIAGYQLF